MSGVEAVKRKRVVYNKLCVAKAEGCSRNVSEKKNFVCCINLVNGKFCSEASNGFGRKIDVSLPYIAFLRTKQLRRLKK